MARPTKLTLETTEKLCEAIRLGSTYELACNFAGISYDVFNLWRNLGRDAKSGKYFEFFNIIKKAEGDATNKWLGHIEDAAQDGNWQAAAWKLERRYPDSYGKRIKQQVQSQNVEIDIASLTDEQLKRLANGEDIAKILSDKN